ncbi:hypothetical protein GCM10009615_14640 [Corynebacterium durum]
MRLSFLFVNVNAALLDAHPKPVAQSAPATRARCVFPGQRVRMTARLLPWSGRTRTYLIRGNSGFVGVDK